VFRAVARKPDGARASRLLKNALAVIPGRAEGASPESSKQELPKSLDSGSAAAPRPGM